MSKYNKFIEFLNNQPSSVVTCSFKQIEEIIDETLPTSAYSYDAWWSNNPSHPLMNLVLESGWTKTNINLQSNQVTFSKSNKQTISFVDLKNFLTSQMTMFANYQPVIIKTLLNSPDYRTHRDIITTNLKEANNFDDKDYAQIAYDVQKEVLGKFYREN